VLLKNEARLYAREIPAFEIKNCVCAYRFTALDSYTGSAVPLAAAPAALGLNARLA
jgi:hypothetical protein